MFLTTSTVIAFAALAVPAASFHAAPSWGVSRKAGNARHVGVSPLGSSSPDTILEAGEAEDLGAIIAAGGGTASVISGEVPFQWRPVETDFCLVPQDSSVSGMTMTKTLNRLTNRVVREVLVRRPAVGGAGEVVDAVPLDAPGVAALRAAFTSAHKLAELANDRPPAAAQASPAQVALDEGLRYFDAVTAVLRDDDEAAAAGGDAGGDAASLEGTFYFAAYERFVAVLAQFGYPLEAATGGAVSWAGDLVEYPVKATQATALADRNFCLSMLDQLGTGGGGQGAPQTVAPSPPQVPAAAASSSTEAPSSKAPLEFGRAVVKKGEGKLVTPDKPAQVPETAEPTKNADASAETSADLWGAFVGAFGGLFGPAASPKESAAEKEAAAKAAEAAEAAAAAAEAAEAAAAAEAALALAAKAAAEAAALAARPMAGLERCGSATRALNLLSNRLRRTLLFGERRDVAALQAALEGGRHLFEAGGAFAPPVSGPLSPNQAQFGLYYDALVCLVRDGLRCEYGSLRDNFLDAFQSLLDSLVESLGETSLGRGTRKDLVMLSEFALWEREVRFNMTGGMWEEHPRDMVGGWSLVESDTASLLSSTLADKFDYEGGGGTLRARPMPKSQGGGQTSSSKARAAATAKGGGGGGGGGGASSSSGGLDKFAAVVRGRLAGEGLSALPVVSLEAGGVVRVMGSSDCTGVEWHMDPGPTHLDTCYITIDAPQGSFAGENAEEGSGGAAGRGERGAAKERLVFMGYIDRGQRIEARFSRRPIRMSGLVVTTASDEKAAESPAKPLPQTPAGKASSRFVMEKESGGPGN